jgi:hypothetical protein
MVNNTYGPFAMDVEPGQSVALIRNTKNRGFQVAILS